MKKQFDKDTFDSIIKSRMAGLKGDPGEAFKRDLLSSIPSAPRAGAGRLQILSISIIFLLLGYFTFFIVEFTQSSARGLTESYSTPNQSESSSARQENAESNFPLEQGGTQYPVANEKGGPDGSVSVKSQDDVSIGSTIALIDATTTQILDGASKVDSKKIWNSKPAQQAEKEEGRASYGLSPLSMLPLRHLPPGERPDVTGGFGYGKAASPHEVIRKTKKTHRWGLYTDLKAFWTYQKITPNQNDEWIVSAIDKQGMLSVDRLGGKLSLGAYYPFARNFEVFGGFSVQLDQFTTVMHVHSVEPNDVAFSEPDNAYQPVYHNNEHDIRELIWSTGPQVGLRYFLPYGNRNFWVATSMDYHFIRSTSGSAILQIPGQVVYTNFTFGWSSAITKNVWLNINPELSYTIDIDQSIGGMAEVTPYSWGLNIGLVYRWKGR
jgi:hypothetical protein